MPMKSRNAQATVLTPQRKQSDEVCQAQLNEMVDNWWKSREEYFPGLVEYAERLGKRGIDFKRVVVIERNHKHWETIANSWKMHVPPVPFIFDDDPDQRFLFPFEYRMKATKEILEEATPYSYASFSAWESQWLVMLEFKLGWKIDWIGVANCKYALTRFRKEQPQAKKRMVELVEIVDKVISEIPEQLKLLKVLPPPIPRFWKGLRPDREFATLSDIKEWFDWERERLWLLKDAFPKSDIGHNDEEELLHNFTILLEHIGHSAFPKISRDVGFQAIQEVAVWLTTQIQGGEDVTKCKIATVAKRLGISHTTVRDMMKDGRLTARQYKGATYCFSENELSRYELVLKKELDVPPMKPR